MRVPLVEHSYTEDTTGLADDARAHSVLPNALQ